MFSCGFFLSGSSGSCRKLWWCFPRLSILHIYFDLHCFMKCAFGKQFQQSLFVEANYFWGNLFFLKNSSHSIRLDNQQTYLFICKFSVYCPCISVGFIWSTFDFCSCLDIMFAMGLKYSFKQLSSHLSNSINVMSPYTNETSLVAL